MQAQNETASGSVITVRGATGPAVRAAFADGELTVADGTTVLHRSGGGQAAFDGILQPVRTLGPEVVQRRMEHLL
jgi:hypothetical protein